mmetsp:Transcript_5571/g.8073  ORF Transcript_5571/g.8073 Transcript_5571/m.8073 type:complete len:146 (+) Transcript_5571:67-504(+)
MGSILRNLPGDDDAVDVSCKKEHCTGQSCVLDNLRPTEHEPDSFDSQPSHQHHQRQRQQHHDSHCEEPRVEDQHQRSMPPTRKVCYQIIPRAKKQKHASISQTESSVGTAVCCGLQGSIKMIERGLTTGFGLGTLTAIGGMSGPV